MYINRPSDSFTFYAEGPDDGSFDSTESRDGNRFFGMADSLAEAEEARREFHDANFMVSVLNQQ